MGSIQSSVGLVTGINIADTIDQLMKLEALPKDRLAARQTALRTEQTAIVDLTTLVVGLQLVGKSLARPELFRTKTATASNNSLLNVTVTGKPAVGSYTITPVRQVRSQQTLSAPVSSKNTPLGAGTITIAPGGVVDASVSLDDLNGGAGVQRGKIKITDRSGATATIDLRYAENIQDVLDAINSNENISVRATVEGDAIRLTDQSGLTTTNLRVQEVAGGTTAADLGLASINAAADTAVGGDILSLSRSLSLNKLNDGAGITLRSGVAELQFSLRDQSTLDIQFSGTEKTLGDLLDRINSVGEGKIEAKISSSGDHIEIVDLTDDNGGAFSVANLNGGDLKEKLGLVSDAVGDQITSDRLLGGLQSTLLRSLGGGNGLGALGGLSITDRSGASTTVDLSSASTLEDVIRAINNAGVGVVASVNDARNGIQLVDTTGASASNLIVANADASNTATKLKIEVDAAVSKVNSGGLSKQIISRSTKLSSLNGGAGVNLGKIVVQDGSGASTVLDLKTLGVETIGDVIDAFNSLSIGVRAKLNDAGDGLLIYDTTGQGGKVLISDAGSSTTAKDLRLTGASSLTTVDGQSVEAVNGSFTQTIELSDSDTLEDLARKLNEAGVGVSASIIASGANSSQFELSVLASRGGKAGAFVLDLSAIGLSTTTAVEGRDALAAVVQTNGGAARLYSSTDNQFADAIEGLRFTLKGSSTDPVEVSVTESNSSVATTLQQFVDQYNKIRDKLTSVNFYNQETKQRGPLFGSSVALRIENDLARLVTGGIFGLGDVATLASLGVTMSDTGKLSLNTTQLQEKLASDPNGVEAFFTDATRGFAKKLDDLSEQLAGVNHSLLLGRNNTLQMQIDAFQLRIDSMTERLERRRTVLQTRFYNLELAVQKIQSNQTAISTLQNLAAAFAPSNR